MRSRMPWGVARQIFKGFGLERSKGWDRTISRLNDGDLDYSGRAQELTDALEEHLMCGEKLVRIYTLSNSKMTRLRALLDEIEVPETVFSRQYPLLVDGDELVVDLGTRPSVASIVNYVAGIAVPLASIRYQTTREVMLPTEFSAATAAELGTFNEVIGIRHERHEAIDILWVPATGNKIELRIDYPFGSSIRQAETSLSVAEEQLRELVGFNIFRNPVNLFPAIQSLYDARGDGRMVELGFMVGTSAQKLEKSRRDGGCCRVEAYHLGGAESLSDPIQPYRTAVLWPIDQGDDIFSYPEIILRGTSLNTTEDDPELTEVVIRNCAGFSDYDHVRDRILAHLP